MEIFSYFKGVVRRSAILLIYHVFRVVLKLGKQKNSAAFSCRYYQWRFRSQKVRAYYSTFWHSAPDHNRWRVVKRLVYLIWALSTPDSAILLVHLSGQRKLTFVGENYSFKVLYIIPQLCTAILSKIKSTCFAVFIQCGAHLQFVRIKLQFFTYNIPYCWGTNSSLSCCYTKRY